MVHLTSSPEPRFSEYDSGQGESSLIVLKVLSLGEQELVQEVQLQALAPPGSCVTPSNTCDTRDSSEPQLQKSQMLLECG